MTLAAILFVCLYSAASGLMGTSVWHGQEPQQTPAAKPLDASAAPEKQSSPAASQSPSTAPEAPASTSAQAPPSPASPSSSKPPAKPRRRKKKTASANCTPAAASPAVQGDSSAAANGTSASTPPVNCPPPKKIVRNGGTSEPSIELLGVADVQDSRKRSTDELLRAIDENLKKLAERQLTASQKSTVNQIHQYVDQSKHAVASGDAERGHNLALKARLLSDELTKP